VADETPSRVEAVSRYLNEKRIEHEVVEHDERFRRRAKRGHLESARKTPRRTSFCVRAMRTYSRSFLHPNGLIYGRPQSCSTTKVNCA
jgi:hypothetical protein